MEYTIPKDIQKELSHWRECLARIIEKGGKYTEKYFYIKNRIAEYEKSLEEQVSAWRKNFRDEIMNSTSSLPAFFTTLQRINFFLEIDAADIHDETTLNLLDAQCDLAMYYQLEEQLTKDLS